MQADGRGLMGCASSRNEAKPDELGASTVDLGSKTVDQIQSPLSVLLITNNVSGVFDNVLSRLPLWVNQIESSVASHRPDFIALHLQEIGGTDWKRKGMDYLQHFIQAVLISFPEFWCSGFLCDTDTSEKFTALGSIVLVRKAVIDRVQVWSFGANEGTGAFLPLNTLPSPLLKEPLADANYCQLRQFPVEFFAGGKRSRKVCRPPSPPSHACWHLALSHNPHSELFPTKLCVHLL